MMKKALVSLLEQSNGGFRVCQVEESGDIFAVADTLIWVDCDDNVVADAFYYDGTNILEIPKPVVTLS